MDCATWTDKDEIRILFTFVRVYSVADDSYLDSFLNGSAKNLVHK